MAAVTAGVQPGNSLVVPIAASPCTSGGRTLCSGLSACLLSHQEALSFCGPPIEEGERCHVCDAPAVIEHVSFAWCSCCSMALMHARSLPVIGPLAKQPVLDRAVKNAFLWHRIADRLLETLKQIIISGDDWRRKLEGQL